MNVAIRTATMDDVDALTEVRRRASLSNEREREWLLQVHPEFLDFAGEHVPKGWTRVAVVDGGRIAGFATAIPEGDRFELEDLFVDPDDMRRGLGTALIRDLAEQARQCGVRRVEVTANTHALAFYESAGFVVDGMTETEGGDAPRMHLDLPA